ncbi:MAG: desulfoferrodoxin [Eubacteriaceae bacterium]|nr:desulfoferrodoxin [Eubacteriaceae bacterium]
MGNKNLLCNICGSYAQFSQALEFTGVTCCSQQMQELEAILEFNEKHTPQVSVKGSRVTVRVGAVDHPMEEDHSIMYIELVQSDKAQRIYLNLQCHPVASFILDTLMPFEVYAFCNIHGLYKTSAEVPPRR